MRFHVLGLPQVGTTKDYYLCGFVPAIVNFCKMMKSLGHTVILYTSEENTAPCDEAVTVITKEEQKEWLGDTNYVFAPFEITYGFWGLMNDRIIAEIAKRKQPHDFICTIAGSSQKAVAEAHPDLMTVEYQVGYEGAFAKYCVFGTHAWRQYIYGKYSAAFDSRFFDAVIPLAYDLYDYPTPTAPKEDFVLYAGRMTPRKGICIAIEAAKRAKVKLKLIGPGKPPLLPEGCEYLGTVSHEERNRLMAAAQAVLVPTLYNEPFGSVVVEANLCGTPVITTDWGSFPELVQNGVNGFRCNLLGEFAFAIDLATELNRGFIRNNAIAKYSLETIAPRYQAYFERLMTLWEKGWDT